MECEGRTGPRSFSAVSSRTFSMADLEGSRGRGRTIVALLPFSRSAIVVVWKCGCGPVALRLWFNRTLQYYIQEKECAGS